MLITNAAKRPAPKPDWFQALSKYKQSNLRRAIWQLVNTFIPYLILWGLMAVLTLQGYTYWLILALAVPAGGLLVRIFIFFHDCCHGSFFASRQANRILGYITGILIFTPYDQWQRSHAEHHATAGNLDRRGKGDVWTMTVEEYLAAPRLKRLAYRLFRNPWVMFGLGPAFMFLIAQRFANPRARKRDRYSVVFTNLALLALIGVMSLTIGWQTYLLVQLPITIIAATMGVWLFYVQHQFEGVYWARHQDWDPIQAAIAGSSYYHLPRVLQWFSGSIGLHHIHHLRQDIPNYNLQPCYDDIPAVQTVKPLTLRSSLKCLQLNLWDETQQKLVSFGSLKMRSQQIQLSPGA